MKYFPGPPADSIEEIIAQTDPSLSLFSGEEEVMSELDQRPILKLTQFGIYVEPGHLCHLDGGAIEANHLLFAVLGETCDDPRELVLIEDCEDLLLSAVVNVVNVKYKPMDPIKWKAEGGSDDPSLFQSEEDHSDTMFWYRHLYHGRTGRFEDPPECPDVVKTSKDVPAVIAWMLSANVILPNLETSWIQSVLTASNGTNWISKSVKQFSSNRALMQMPDGSIVIKEKIDPEEDDIFGVDYDVEYYPEKYRKTDNIKGLNNDTLPLLLAMSLVLPILRKLIINNYI